jgi:signal transduction histidine kinase
MAAAVCLAAGLPLRRGGALALVLSVLVASRWAGRTAGYAATLTSALLAVAIVSLAGTSLTAALISTPDGTAADAAGLALLAVLGAGIATWVAPRTPAPPERPAADTGRLKEEFLATVSHELRTPLNAILGWTELLRLPRGVPPHQVEHGLEVIERNARRQLALVEELIAAAEPDASPDAWECLDLRAMLRTLVHGLEPTAAVARIALASDEHPLSPTDVAGAAASETDPVWVQGHPASLRIALRHILDNAIKYTPAGGHVHTRLRQCGDRVMIFVSDTGAGIEAAQLDRVFEPFSQQEMSAARAHGGLGLGLTIARRLIERHGGHLDLRSEGRAQGATALITLPAAARGPG